MKKKWQNRLNVILGFLSVWLLGCNSNKEEYICMYGVPPEALKYGPPEAVALYGVQMPQLEPLDQDSTEVELPNDQNPQPDSAQ